MSEFYRPNVHFTPEAGWINDPNGMIRLGDTWHLFYQHDPDSTLHGPMHWGHATSTDLVTWHHRPVALRPGPLGTCFSGSAVETDAGDVQLFYTAHSLTPNGDDYQVQCVAHADASMTAFTPDPANPIVPNPGLLAFRDPKVVWHAPTGRWIMLVTEGQAIGFYGSDDLVSWQHLSSFGEDAGRHSEGPWECPDLVPLEAPDGSSVWMLIVGLNPGGYALGSGTQYFLGAFDGTVFINANPKETELWLDYGRDYYAAQTFFERGGTRAPIAIAWASNWHYARQTPTEAFRGAMSLPRTLRLVETPKGLRVAASVPQDVVRRIAGDGRAGTGHEAFSLDLAVGERFEVTLFGEDEPHIILSRTDEASGTLRTIRGPRTGMPDFAHDYDVPLDWPATGPLDLEVFYDRGILEASVNGGVAWVTTLYFPENPDGPLSTRTR